MKPKIILFIISLSCFYFRVSSQCISLDKSYSIIHNLYDLDIITEKGDSILSLKLQSMKGSQLCVEGIHRAILLNSIVAVYETEKSYRLGEDLENRFANELLSVYEPEELLNKDSVFMDSITKAFSLVLEESGRLKIEERIDVEDSTCQNSFNSIVAFGNSINTMPQGILSNSRSVFRKNYIRTLNDFRKAGLINSAELDSTLKLNDICTVELALRYILKDIALYEYRENQFLIKENLIDQFCGDSVIGNKEYLIAKQMIADSIWISDIYILEILKNSLVLNMPEGQDLANLVSVNIRRLYEMIGVEEIDDFLIEYDTIKSSYDDGYLIVRCLIEYKVSGVIYYNDFTYYTNKDDPSDRQILYEISDLFHSVNKYLNDEKSDGRIHFFYPKDENDNYIDNTYGLVYLTEDQYDYMGVDYTRYRIDREKFSNEFTSTYLLGFLEYMKQIDLIDSNSKFT